MSTSGYEKAPLNQTPSKWEYGTQGEIIIARNPKISARFLSETNSNVSALSSAEAEPAEQPSGVDGQAAATQAEASWTSQPESTSPETEREYTTEPIVANDYWTVGDQLDYEPYAVAISEFIRHEGTIPPLTIGIKAPWGAGKTSLMHMVQDRLDPPSTNGGPALGSERRQKVTLTPASRWLIVGRPRWRRLPDDRLRLHETSTNVTNQTLLRKLRRQQRRPTSAGRSTSTKPASDAEDLKIEPPDPSWRPTVWFSPWMYQSGEQVWAGLAHEVISQITSRMQPGDREAFWLELNLRRVDADALRRRVHRALLERLVPLAGGLGLIVLVAAALFFLHLIVPSAASNLNLAAKGLVATGAAGAALAGAFRVMTFWQQPISGSLTTLTRQPDYVQDWQKLVGEQWKGAYSELVRNPGYESRLGYLYLVQTDMRRVLDLIATRDRPVIIFIDDLDRCSPSTVTKVIEAINLFLAGQFPNGIFIVAMDPDMVAAHIEVAYSSLVASLINDDYWGDARALGWRFLDKIVQLPISLPILRSDQASQFLGTALVDAPEVADHNDAQANLDTDRLRLIEEALQRQHPSIGNITEAASTAEGEISGSPQPAQSLSPEAQEAIRRELRRRLHPDDPEVQAIVAAVTGRLAKNPREIKRFVNVFRFYAVLRQEREVAGFPAPDTLAEIAKLAVIAVRWPHLRAALGHQVGATERDTVLALLEDCAAELPESVDRTERKATFHAALTNAGIPEGLCAKLLASDDLCELLACSPSIGTAAAGYL